MLYLYSIIPVFYFILNISSYQGKSSNFISFMSLFLCMCLFRVLGINNLKTRQNSFESLEVSIVSQKNLRQIMKEILLRKLL